MVGSVNLNEPDLVGGEHDDGYGLGGEVRRLIKAIEGKEVAEKENEGEVARLSTRLAHAHEQVLSLEWCFIQIIRGVSSTAFWLDPPCVQPSEHFTLRVIENLHWPMQTAIFGQTF